MKTEYYSRVPILKLNGEPNLFAAEIYMYQEIEVDENTFICTLKHKKAEASVMQEPNEFENVAEIVTQNKDERTIFHTTAVSIVEHLKFRHVVV